MFQNEIQKTKIVIKDNQKIKAKSLNDDFFELPFEFFISNKIINDFILKLNTDKIDIFELNENKSNLKFYENQNKTKVNLTTQNKINLQNQYDLVVLNSPIQSRNELTDFNLIHNLIDISKQNLIILTKSNTKNSNEIDKILIEQINNSDISSIKIGQFLNKISSKNYISSQELCKILQNKKTEYSIFKTHSLNSFNLMMHFKLWAIENSIDDKLFQIVNNFYNQNYFELNQSKENFYFDIFIINKNTSSRKNKLINDFSSVFFNDQQHSKESNNQEIQLFNLIENIKNNWNIVSNKTDNKKINDSDKIIFQSQYAKTHLEKDFLRRENKNLIEKINEINNQIIENQNLINDINVKENKINNLKTKLDSIQKELFIVFSQVQNSKKIIADKNRNIYEKEKNNEILQFEIRKLINTHQEQTESFTQKIHQLETQFHAIESSLSFYMIQKYRSLKDKYLFPVSSKRRKTYDRALSSLKSKLRQFSIESDSHNPKLVEWVQKIRTFSRYIRYQDWQGFKFELAQELKLIPAPHTLHKNPDPLEISPELKQYVQDIQPAGYDWGNPDAYDRWLTAHPFPTFTEYKIRLAQAAILPKISFVIPVYNVDEIYLDAAIKSILNQYYANFEICLVNDASTAPHIAPALNHWLTIDSRIRVRHLPHNGGISIASQVAVEMATGDYIAILDNDDEIAEQALAEIVLAINRNPAAEWLYSDFVFKRPDNRFQYPFFKPDWSPEKLMNQMFMNHFQVIKREVLTQVGGFRQEFEGSQDYDLALRLMEAVAADKIVHIPRPLYHWRIIVGSSSSDYFAKPYANENAKKALRSALCRRGLAHATDGKDGRDGCDVLVEDGASPGIFKIHYKIVKDFKVSIIVPFKDQWAVTRRCIESILKLSTYSHFELILINNQSVEPETLHAMQHIESQDPRIKLLHYDRPFNHSAICNFGVQRSDGEILLLLNNDIEVETPDWIELMLVHAQNREVGCVGSLLLYPNGLVQHAGVVVGPRGLAAHAFRHFPRHHPGYHTYIQSINNVSAVTGACLMVRREVYEAVGGLDEVNVPVSFNDVHFCLSVDQAGYRNVYTGQCVLIHHESLSRGFDVAEVGHNAEWMRKQWGNRIWNDPYYSPNLTLDYEDFRFRE